MGEKKGGMEKLEEKIKKVLPVWKKKKNKTSKAEEEDLSIEDYKSSRVLYRGTDTIVYEAVKEGTKVVIKRVPRSDDTKGSVYVEVCVGKVLKHDRIVELLDYCETIQYTYLMFKDVGDGIDMYRYMEKRHFRPLTELTSKHVFKDILSAVSYCHSKGVVHLDIKLENIIFGPGLTPHLTDFGLACFYSHKSKFLTTYGGSLQYAAPEVLGAIPYDGFKADAWSCGVVLFCMLFGEFPWSLREYNALETAYSPLEFPKVKSPHALSLLRSVLVNDPSQRYSISDMLAHPWLRLNEK